MRAAIIGITILLLPAALFAGPSMGVYFGSQMHYNPMPLEHFIGYVYSMETDCFLNGVEFALELPYDPIAESGIFILGVSGPYGDLAIGQLPQGISMAFFPPMAPGTNLIAEIEFFADNWCWNNGGTLQDSPLRVIGHPDTGLIRGTCFPESTLFEYVGLTSTICPDVVSVQQSNWGAIKSLF
jgi:hypothetical protein